jgi:hypothetical protein
LGSAPCLRKQNILTGNLICVTTDLSTK